MNGSLKSLLECPLDKRKGIKFCVSRQGEWFISCLGWRRKIKANMKAF